MPIEARLETYLSNLDKALGQIPVSDRADIITEIKSHVLEAQERDASQDLGAILSSLGEPETVANRYLLERGFKASKSTKNTTKSPIVKWLIIGFLGTFGIAMLSALALVWKFSPVLRIDAENERVTILGGLIDIDGKEERVTVGSSSVHSSENYKVFEGSKAIDLSKYSQIVIPFSNGKLEFRSSGTQQLRWNCRFQGEPGAALLSESGKIITLSLLKTHGVKCEVQLPPGLDAKIEGNNGDISINRPQHHLSVKLDNGNISIHPDPEKKYSYDIHLVNGQSEGFSGSDDHTHDLDVIRIQASVVNGHIVRD